MVKIDYGAYAYVAVGILFYAIAILTTFTPPFWERSTLGPTLGSSMMISSTTLAGLGAVVVGYVMILALGGYSSIGVIKFISHLTHSKQIVEISQKPTESSRKDKLLDRAQWLYVPGLVFIASVGLAWDIHNADGPGAGFFQPLLRSLDVFSRPPPGEGLILFSRHLIPAFLILTLIAGLAPALVLPYFDKFKVTGLNAGPFNYSILYLAAGAFVGLGLALTLLGLFYRSLWLNRAPLPYHFGILALLGFSLHFSLGLYLGMRRAEGKILKAVHDSESGKLLILA